MRQEITHLHQEVVSLTATVTSAPRTTPEVEEWIATIQTTIAETTRWVDVARRAPKAAVSATIVEQEQRASKALNIRVHGTPRADSSTPLTDTVAFMTTLGLAEHGIEHAWRTGWDPTRPQPLIIRFRDTQAQLAALRQRATLRDHPTIFMDEDLTPMQVEERRTLLQQRDVARQEGKWAVV